MSLLIEALQRIADSTEDGCSCDHSTIDCCARQRDVFCSRCLAATALSAYRQDPPVEESAEEKYGIAFGRVAGSPQTPNEDGR